MPFIIQIKIASNCFLTYPWTILFSESPLPWFQDVFSVSFGSSHQLFGQNLAWSFTARNLYQLQMTAALGTTHVLEVWSRSGGLEQLFNSYFWSHTMDVFGVLWIRKAGAPVSALVTSQRMTPPASSSLLWWWRLCHCWLSQSASDCMSRIWGYLPWGLAAITPCNPWSENTLFLFL